MKPFVSIVIPVYNRPGKIVSAAKSVQAQTYRNWEMVVVDDGSTDNTREAVARLTREDSRIRLIEHERNRGAQAARNTGIRAAQGEWVAFLDSDDLWLPDSLELRLGVAERENVSVVHSASYIIRENGRRELYNLPRLSGRVYKELLVHDGPMFQSLLVSRKALKQIGYLDERIVSFQEWDSAIRLAKFYPFGFEPTPTFVYDYRNEDSISRDDRRAGVGYEQVFRKHLMAILGQTGPGVLAKHYEVAARWYREGGDKIHARRCAIMALLWKCLSPGRIYGKLKRLLSNP